MPIGDGKMLRGAIRGALREIPVVGTLLGTAGAGMAPPAPAQLDRLADALAARMEADPVVKNQMNAEHPVQSRVVVGSTFALIAGAFMGADQIVGMVQAGSFNPELAAGAAAAIFGAGYALYGRLKTGLAPLFTRKKA